MDYSASGRVHYKMRRLTRERLNSDPVSRLKTQKCSFRHLQDIFDDNLNKPRTAKVGAISKAQNLKGGLFGLCETPAGCKKFEKKWRGDPLETWKNFPKIFLMRFLNSVTVPKNVKGGPFAIFWHPLCCKISKQMKGGPSGANQKLQKKCWKKVGLRCVFEVVDVCFVFSFRFGRASEVGVVEVWSCWSLRLLNKWTKKWTFRV